MCIRDSRREVLDRSDNPDTPPTLAPIPPATSADREAFFAHLQKLLTDLDFIKVDRPMKLMRKIRHLYMKVQPNSDEVNILRGIMTAMEKISKKER